MPRCIQRSGRLKRVSDFGPLIISSYDGHMTKNRLDINVGCGRIIFDLLLGASIFVLAVGFVLLLIPGFLFYG